MRSARHNRGKGNTKGPMIMAQGLDTSRARRKMILEEVLRAYFETNPVGAAEAVKAIQEVTKAEVKDGKWENEDVYVKIRMPAMFFQMCRQTFPVYMPDEPNFLDEESDFEILFEVIPIFTQQGASARRTRGKGRR